MARVEMARVEMAKIERTKSSIKRRLVWSVVASQALLAAGLLCAGVFYTYRRLLSTLDANMQAHAMSLAALVRYSEDTPAKLYFDSTLTPQSVDPQHPDLYAVWRENNELLTRSPNWPKQLQLTNGANHWNFESSGIPYHGIRLSRVPVLDREEGVPRPETLNILYASPTLHLRSQIKNTAIFIAISSLVLLSVTVLLALWGIRKGLLPLQNLADEAALVSANNWQLHLPPQVEEVEELHPLTESMTRMLSRLERSFEQQREFLGNAAHELKTPVAVLKSTLQSLLHRPRSSEEYRAGLEQSLQDLERLERLLEWMLRLARAEQWAHGALRRDLEVVDVTVTCEAAVERIRAWAESRRTQVHLLTNGTALFRADPEDLQLVWTNLLENAVRYSPEGSSVEVAVHSNNGGPARITFQDHGSGIPASDLPHIFERFYRGDPSRDRATGGFGLGLAIAKGLIAAYGGTITADSTPGKGTRMTVELPAGGTPLELSTNH